jgi:alpha-D-ribose 1-methylphosphonate 5-triphosphate diphosphatase
VRDTDDSYVLGNARIVTRKDDISGALTVEQGRIAGVSRKTPARFVDCEGDYLLPGFIDVHTDNFEKHAIPRSGVIWNLFTAAGSHDATMIAAGTTTVFDSLVAGGAGNATRRNLLPPAIAAIDKACDAGLLRADHFLHVRCDIVERASASLADALLDHPKLRFVTFIDDQPERDPERAALVHERRRGLQRGSLNGAIAPTPEEDFAGAEDRRRRLVAECQRRNIPVANHDDTKAAHVGDAARLGMRLSEFPITLEAATAARAHGMMIICGAPNLVRGGSHTGNVSVADLIRAGMVDVLCSDYIPSSILQAVFLLASETFSWSLPSAVALASDRPAELFGLTDRGRIEEGRQADLIRVRLVDGVPAVHSVWRAGRLVFGAIPARSRPAIAIPARSAAPIAAVARR